ncbi:IS3 family transposase [Fusibacter sp. JL216-2]|uniref:IS3 family transposase n=1 Tax=Fusibacter sp. JL216-2 TaxID=3071453 RepID=UPI003D342B0B
MGSARLKYKVIQQLRHKYTVSNLCRILGVSSSGYYKWLKHPESKRTKRDKYIAKLIKEYQEKIKFSYGYRRITIWLNKVMRIKINHKSVLRIMNKFSLCSIIRRSRNITHSKDCIHKYENKLKRQFNSTRKNEKWSTDITQFKCKDGILYLSALKDLYDGSILGYSYAKNSKTPIVISTVSQALKHKRQDNVTILHSDMGSQYTSHEYHVFLNDNRIEPSMSRPGTPIDNSPIESFFSTLKIEWLSDTSNMMTNSVAIEIDEYINFYNNERIQLKSTTAPVVVRNRAA